MVGVLLLLDLFTAVRTVALLAALGLVLTGASELVAAGRYAACSASSPAVLVAGGLAAAWPDITLWALAVVAGIGLVVSGVARIMGAVSLRVEGWGWLLVGGAGGGGGRDHGPGVAGGDDPGPRHPARPCLRMVVFGVSEVMFALAVRRGAPSAGGVALLGAGLRRQVGVGCPRR